MREVVRRSIHQGSPAYGRQDAIEEGGTFRIAQDRVRADEQYIADSGGLATAARKKHDKKMERDERMTKAKIRDTISRANPERDKLLQMCAEEDGGVKVLLPPGFEPNSKHPTSMPRPSQASQEAAGALHKIFDKTYLQPDLCFAVTKEFALNLELKPHISPCSHGWNDGKKLGRGCVNNTAGGKPLCQPLNSEWLREAAKEEHRPIRNPQIQHIVDLVIRMR